jgi:hypothetical protein
LPAFAANAAWQPLKSFRDRSVDFTVYRPDGFDFSYLHSLGALERQDRRFTVGEELADSSAEAPVDANPPSEHTPN